MDVSDSYLKIPQLEDVRLLSNLSCSLADPKALRLLSFDELSSIRAKLFYENAITTCRHRSGLSICERGGKTPSASS